ncbi:MAG: magnesium transporter [Oscillospiraceae bacterium]
MEKNNFEELLNLLEKGDFSGLKQQISDMNVVDIAEFLETLETPQLIRVFRILPKDISADVFSYLETDDQTDIVSSITDSELGSLVGNLFVDDAVDFLEEVPANVVTRVLANTDQKTRQVINTFLSYPENSAGSLMTNEMVELHDSLTVAQSIARIRSTGFDKETIYSCYCIDKGRHLIGTVTLSDLIFNNDAALIHDIMDADDQLICVNTRDDQEDVAEIAKKYDLLSIPVVDNENRLVGIITIDDIVDIIEEENTEDFEKMALLTPSDDEYLKTPVIKLVKNRIVWLLILMISATLTSKIIEGFENTLALVVGLTASIPMLMGTGGNAANQTSTLTIRGMALGEVKLGDYPKVLFKEVRVGLICGVILAVVNYARMWLLGSPGGSSVYLVTGMAMFFAIVVAKSIGCTLPMIAKILKLDPALMAGPMISTMVDALTLVIYFSLARVFLM